MFRYKLKVFDNTSGPSLPTTPVEDVSTPVPPPQITLLSPMIEKTSLQMGPVEFDRLYQSKLVKLSVIQDELEKAMHKKDKVILEHILRYYSAQADQVIRKQFVSCQKCILLSVLLSSDEPLIQQKTDFAIIFPVMVAIEDFNLLTGVFEKITLTQQRKFFNDFSIELCKELPRSVIKAIGFMGIQLFLSEQSNKELETKAFAVQEMGKDLVLSPKK